VLLPVVFCSQFIYIYIYFLGGAPGGGGRYGVALGKWKEGGKTTDGENRQ
jgi:hypothetical protein